MDMAVTNTLTAQRAAVRALLYAGEADVAVGLLERQGTPKAARTRIAAQAREIVACARTRRAERGVLEIFLQEFGLSTDEGIALLSLAEALLRVPDSDTADNLIAEKIHSGSWERHQAQSDSALVNLSTRALMLTSSIVDLDVQFSSTTRGALHSLLNRLSEPVVRIAIR